MLITDHMPRVLAVIDLIGQGHTLTDALNQQRMTFSTFRHYVNNVPELSAAYADAEQRGYDTMADALLRIFDSTANPYGESDPKRAKLISDNIKWYLARKRPHLYGDKTVVEHNITADKTIVEALERGKRAVAQAVLTDVAYSVVEDVATLPAELSQFA